MAPNFSNRRSRAGFTLIEVLLVLVILVILGSLAVTVVSGVRKSAFVKSAQAQVDVLSENCQLYESDMHSFPSSLDDLRHRPGAQNADQWNGPYSDRDLGLDPWSNAYQYDASGQHHQGEKPDIWSNGPPGDNKPIYNQ